MISLRCRGITAPPAGGYKKGGNRNALPTSYQVAWLFLYSCAKDEFHKKQNPGAGLPKGQTQRTENQTPV